MEPVASSSRADLQTGCSQASTSQEITFIESQRGVPIILHAGYEYTKKRENKNSSIVWRCVNRRCHGGMVTSNNNVTKILRHDICTPSIARNDIKEEIHRCKQEAKSSEGKSIPSVFNSSIKKLLDKGTDKIEKLPELSNVKNSLYSARNKAQQIKKATFKTPFEVKIPVSYMSFVLFDCGYRKTRILAFADVNSKGLHQHVKHYLADGTFKCVVKPFRQLYVIYGDLGSTSEKIHVVPLIYILLMDKKESTYETAFALIKSQFPEWHPISFRTDYEKAAMNAIRNIFPDVICKGCYFHFSQALWKRAKALKLNKKRMFKKHIALCTALALLPPELKCDGWLYIMEDCPKTLNIEKFNDYFVSAWLDNEYYRGKWDFWGDIYRTNNPVEGSNAKLNRTYSGKLNIISFLNVIKNDAVLSLARQGKPRRADDIAHDKYIFDSVTAMLNGTISLGHCLEKISPFVY